MGIKETPTGGVPRNTLCKCGCGFPTGQRNGYVRLHTPKVASTTVKLRKDGHGGYLWTDGSGSQWSLFSWSWPAVKPFGMGPQEWERMRAPEWFENGLTWHLNGPDGYRVKSFRSLWEVKQYLAQL